MEHQDRTNTYQQLLSGKCFLKVKLKVFNMCMSLLWRKKKHLFVLVVIVTRAESNKDIQSFAF